jgi:hypothetical protein
VEIYEGPDLFEDDIFDNVFEDDEEDIVPQVRRYDDRQAWDHAIPHADLEDAFAPFELEGESFSRFERGNPVPFSACSSGSASLDHERTTLMLSNIPTRCKQAHLLKIWPADGTYDFLYLPCRFGEHTNFGYAFINFVSHDLAKQFCELWQEMPMALGKQPGSKPLMITWADIQGRDQNIKHSLNRKIKRIRNPQFQPAIFQGRQRLDFNKYLDYLGTQHEYRLRPVGS